MEPYNHNPSEVKVPEFYWDSSYSMADNRAVMAQQPNMDRRSKRSPGVFRPEQDPVPRMPFEKSLLEKPSELMSHSSSFLSLTGFSVNQERYPNSSMFNEVYGKNLTTSSKAELNPSVASQETSLYSLLKGPHGLHHFLPVQIIRHQPASLLIPLTQAACPVLLQRITIILLHSLILDPLGLQITGIGGLQIGGKLINQPWVVLVLIISQQRHHLRAVGIRLALRVAPGQATAPPWRIPLLSSWKA